MYDELMGHGVMSKGIFHVTRIFPSVRAVDFLDEQRSLG